MGANFDNVALQKQNAICKKGGKTQNAIELLNYLKRIALQQLIVGTQVFTKIFLSGKNASATVLIKKRHNMF